MDKTKIDALFELLDATSGLVVTHKENFKIVENEINSIKNFIQAQGTLIGFLTGSLSALSPEFKDNFEKFAEEMLSQKEISPALESQLRGLLSGINGNPLEPQERPNFVLHHGGKDDQSK